MTARMILREAADGRWRSFSAPDRVLEAMTAAEVPQVLRQAEQLARAQGGYAVGYVSYEAAQGFETALTTHEPASMPLARFGIYAFAEEFEPPEYSESSVAHWQFLESRANYQDRLTRIHDALAGGRTYQVNYTTRLESSEIRDPWSWYLATGLDAPYSAYLEFDDFVIASASPELFFRSDGDVITTRPMKGTARRGLTVAEDMAQRQALAGSEKNRAENIMITDMLRNDLGRIAEPGSVAVTSLLDIEKYPTVWQMTSTVEARTDASVAEIFDALFPCASVTGAPKVSSMKLIAELESLPRGVYTGAIGYIGPQQRSQFSVAIRTAVIDRQSGVGHYGVGGGIVWDSDPDEEYDECLTKSLVVTSAPAHRNFELLETILWHPADGFVLLNLHLDRLCASADYFDFPCSKVEATALLADSATSFGRQACRIRLLLNNEGGFRLGCRHLESADDQDIVTLRLAGAPVDTRNPFLYHKTTDRRVYEQALSQAQHCDDVLLWNDAGEITETTIANIIVTMAGRRYTPPVSSGLLGGTLRQHLLDSGDVTERVIRLEDLGAADSISLVNSVRGEYAAILAEGVVAPRRAG